MVMIHQNNFDSTISNLLKTKIYLILVDTLKLFSLSIAIKIIAVVQVNNNNNKNNNVDTNKKVSKITISNY